MRIAILTNEYPPNVYGGAGVHVEYLTKELMDVDGGEHSINVVSFGEQRVKSSNLCVTGVNPLYDFSAQEPGHKKFLDTIFKNVIMSGALNDVDIVHCHTWYSHFAGLLIKQLLQIPLVLTTHSLEPHRPWKYEQLGSAYYASSWLEKTAYKNADAVVAVSESMKRDVHNLYDVSLDKIKIIHNGIDLNLYKPTINAKIFDKYNIDKKNPFILFVGRITRQKGIIHLINAIKYINPGYQIVLCAGSPDTEEIASEMQEKFKQAKKNSKNKIIWIQEMVPREDIVALYSQASVFVCPSVYEPFGIINLEAMACETPVVAADVGGIPEVVVPDETGLLVPFTSKSLDESEPADPEKFAYDLAEAVNYLISCPEKMKKMGVNARQRVIDHFSWKSIASKTMGFYKELTGNDKKKNFNKKFKIIEHEDRNLRVQMESVQPKINGGRFPIKRIVGEKLKVKADIFVDGHNELSVVLLYRKKDNVKWLETPMKHLVNDRWCAEFEVNEIGIWKYTIQAWVDHFKSWQRDFIKRVEADQDISIDLLIGSKLIKKACEKADLGDKKKLNSFIRKLKDKKNIQDAKKIALSDELRNIMMKYPDKRNAVIYKRELEVVVDPKIAGFSSWYEMFPRSCSSKPGKHGTFKDVIDRLPYVAEMGFNVIYFPPIHPIGTQFRKGKNNSLKAKKNEVGSPWAIGNKDGGHKSIHPDLGALEDFQEVVKEAEKLGLFVALDLAYQCSPDHPYVKEHPEWFRRRPDNTIQYAENPPKKYQDIYPLEFETESWEELREELKSIVLFWIKQGVKIFRVDNPHTKDLSFWEWMIASVKKEYPDIVFLAEAFTRPKLMYRLAKIGFSQSYNYFPWRNTKHELIEFFTEITKTESIEFFRPNLWPNTPDILTENLRFASVNSFRIRFVLAATLGANYGIYGPAFELCENQPFKIESEEYLNSEKYEIKYWDIDTPNSLRTFITQINHIRNNNNVMHSDRNLEFLSINNDSLICYAKHNDDFSEIMIFVVNLDPYNVQKGCVEIPCQKFGFFDKHSFQVHDLLDGNWYTWNNHSNFVSLDPSKAVAHVFRVV